MRSILSLLAVLVLFSCAQEPKKQPFQSVAVSPVFQDSVSIRAITFLDGRTLAFAGSNGMYGTVDVSSNKVRASTQYYDSITPSFRAVGGTSEDFFPYTPIGFGFAYDHMRQNFNYNSRTKTDGTDYTASVSKFSHLFNGFANVNLHFGWRFYVELRAEIGVGYYEVNNSHNELLNDSEGFESNWSKGRVENRKEFAPNIALNVRVNYSLWVD